MGDIVRGSKQWAIFDFFKSAFLRDLWTLFENISGKNESDEKSEETSSGLISG